MSTAPSPLCYDPKSHGFYQNPFPLYARLRAESPLHTEPVLGGELWDKNKHEFAVYVTSLPLEFNAWQIMQYYPKFRS